MKNNSLIAFVLVGILIIFGAGAYFYSNYSSNELSKESENVLVRDDALISGNSDAKVTIVEFLDPSCGTCIYFFPIVESIKNKYEGKVKVVYRFLPYYSGSDFIFSLVKAANEQGKLDETLKQFFTQHERWYANHQLNHFVAWGIMQEADVNIEDAQEFLTKNSEQIQKHLKQNEDDAQTLKVTGTPTFYVNGKLLTKLSEIDLLKLVESEIKKFY